MRKTSFVVLFALSAIALGLPPSGAHAGLFGIYGNHEGGLISWSPDVDRTYGQIAAEHCAWYNKVAYITGVNRSYGNYISFTCRYHRRYDPVKAGQSFWSLF